jgi:hypothetical protein
VRIKNLDYSVILDAGKQPDDVIVGGGVHPVMLARTPRG